MSKDSGSPAIGHNSVAGGQLKSLVERIERLAEEKKAIADDIKDVYAEAKGAGFDTKIMRIIIQQRKLDVDTRREINSLLDVYWHALGGIFE